MTILLTEATLKETGQVVVGIIVIVIIIITIIITEGCHSPLLKHNQ
jgi:hypothetical protein